MFGKIYSANPQALFGSFEQMNKRYKISSAKRSPIISRLLKVYLQLFGVPEIGFQLRHLYFLKLIRKNLKSTPREILDAGCGIGSYSFLLAKIFPKSIIDGVDVDKNKLALATDLAEKLGKGNVNFYYMDIAKAYRKRKKYDLVVNIDVLEHIEDYRSVIRNFHKMLSHGGYVYIHTPAPNQKRIFSTLESWEHEDHVREGIEPSLLKRDLEETGFKVLEMVGTHGFFGKLAWEINHILLSKSLVMAGAIFPLLYLISKLDLLVNNKSRLCTAVIAKRT